MNIEIFTICERGLEEGGAVSVIRTIESFKIGPASFQFQVVCVVRFFPDEEGPHTARIRLEGGPEGLVTIDREVSRFEVDLQGSKYDSWRYIEIFRFDVALPLGEHRCTLFIDDREKISVPLYVEP
jgi:hypothetical protein